jgi:hypothetical protein
MEKLDENKDNTSGFTPHGIPEEDPQYLRSKGQVSTQE